MGRNLKREKIVKRIFVVVCIILTFAIAGMSLTIAAVNFQKTSSAMATSEHVVKSVSDKKYINVYIVKNDKNNIRFISREGVIDIGLSSALDEDISGQVGDVTVSKGEVTAITVKTSVITGAATEIGEDTITIEGYGVLPVSDDFNIFNPEDSSKIKTERNILKNYGEVDFILFEDKLQAAVLEEENTENIRVIINNTGFSSVYHEKVSITADENFTLKYSDGTAYKNGEKGSEIVLNKSDLSSGDANRQSVVVECAGGEIGILSIKRNNETPYYRGKIYINYTEKGLTIINELPIESYLYSVVPSEMPASYPQEALMAQAVCARSFAYKQIEESSFHELGADVDDSTVCQVYNNQATSESVIKAVDSTSGQVLMGGNDVLKAYYYSTSCGSGAGVDEVWAGDEVSYYDSDVYISNDSISEQTVEVFSVVMDEEFSADMLDKQSLSDEKAFRDFIDGECITYKFENITVKETIKTYDSEFGWYRWSINESVDNFSKVFNDNLVSSMKSYGNKIKVFDGGKYVEKSISTIGTIEKMEVTKRGESGIATEMVIYGTQNTIKVSMQSAIRTLLAPEGLTVKLSDGTKRESMDLLPSAFFYVDVTDGKIIINGGGYGHGVGMSQNGAKAMADAGLKYTEILAEYFPGSEVKVR